MASVAMSGDPNLPGGCTDRDIDEHMGADVGYEECPDCVEGQIDGEKCGTCDGSGEIEFSIKEREQAAKEEHEIDRWEDERMSERV